MSESNFMEGVEPPPPPVLQRDKKPSAYRVKVTDFVKGTPFQATVDTGCTKVLIDSHTFNWIEKKWPDLCLKPTKTRAFPHNCRKPIKLLRKFKTAVENNK